MTEVIYQMVTEYTIHTYTCIYLSIVWCSVCLLHCFFTSCHIWQLLDLYLYLLISYWWPFLIIPNVCQSCFLANYFFHHLLLLLTSRVSYHIIGFQYSQFVDYSGILENICVKFVVSILCTHICTYCRCICGTSSTMNLVGLHMSYELYMYSCILL